MNEIIKYLSVLSVFILLSSCSKDVIEPLPNGNSPIFNVSGQINGNAISISAGESGAFMNTSTSFKNNVEQFEGSLENAQVGFTINLTDGMLDIPTFNSNIEDFESFKIAPYSFGEPLAIFGLDNLPNSEYISDIQWTVDGEDQSSSTLKIYEPGVFEVCLSTIYIDGSKGYSCNEVIIGYQKNVNSVLRHMVSQSSNTIAFLDSPNEPISSIDWKINDSVVSTSASENFKTDNINLDRYRLGADVTYQNGVKRKKEVFVNTQSVNNYISDFSIMENQSTAHWDHSAAVTVRHNQKEYRAIQNGANTAAITINDVVSFDNNSDGDKVSVFKGTLSCSFIDLETEEIVDGEFEFSFGVAH